MKTIKKVKPKPTVFMLRRQKIEAQSILGRWITLFRGK